MNKKCKIFIPLFLILTHPGLSFAQSPPIFTREPTDEKGYISELDNMLHQRKSLRKEHDATSDAITAKLAKYSAEVDEAVETRKSTYATCESKAKRSADYCPNLERSATNAENLAKRNFDDAQEKLNSENKNFTDEYLESGLKMLVYRKKLASMGSLSKWAQGPPQLKKQLAEKDALLKEALCQQGDMECMLKEAKAKSKADSDAALTKLKVQLKAASEQNAKLAKTLRIATLKLKSCQGNSSGKQPQVSNTVSDNKAEVLRNTDLIGELTPTTPILRRQADTENAIPAVLTVPQAAPKAK